jgi:hypothetical protein
VLELFLYCPCAKIYIEETQILNLMPAKKDRIARGINYSAPPEIQDWWNSLGEPKAATLTKIIKRSKEFKEWEKAKA